MSYKLEDITKMIDAGFTAVEIRALDTDGLFTYAASANPQPAADPQPKADPQPAAQDPQPAAQDPQPAALDPKSAAQGQDKSDMIKELEDTINKGFQSIINAFQVSAVGGSQQKIPEAKTSEDILAEIISPYNKEGGSK